VKRLLYRLTNRLPCRIIADDGRPYLERYYLCSIGRTRFYLHRFVGSDPDRGLHSHPWSWAVSLVLSGWYFEERFSGTETPFLRRVRWLNILLGESFHRVVMPKRLIRDEVAKGRATSVEPYLKNFIRWPDECWTLFIHRQADAGRRWGFLRRQSFRSGFASSDVTNALIFTPFTYPGGGTSSGEWWKQVPKGRDEPRRKPIPR
jgi:hypothetical protein